MSPSEPVTVVLSEKGWIRAAKGHESTRPAWPTRPATASSRRPPAQQPAGGVPRLHRAAPTRCQTHNLPSARGQGEPLTGRINPPSGAGFDGLLLGDPGQRCLLASDAGYGFVTSLGELQAKNRSGKAVLTLPAGARPGRSILWLRQCSPSPSP
jgi:topoisomerase-4 subunit A